MTAPARRSPTKGAILALCGALLFGINGSVAKVVIGAGVTAAQLTFLRTLSAAVIAGVILLVSAREQFHLTRRDAAGLAALGIAGVAMIQWLYAVAISRLPVGIALLIEYTAVILVALAAWLIFKEKVHVRLWWAIALVVIGLSVVAEVWHITLDWLGTFAALAAAVAYAFYFLAGERGVARRPAMAVTFWASAFATAFWALFSGWWRLEPAQFSTSVSLTGHLEGVHVPLWVPTLWVITLGAFAPFVLSFAALRHLSATAVGILASAEVLFAFVVAWVWLGETLVAIQIAGAALVLAGIVIAQTARYRGHGEVANLASEVPPEVP